MVVHLLPKQETRVRFSYPAQSKWVRLVRLRRIPLTRSENIIAALAQSVPARHRKHELAQALREAALFTKYARIAQLVEQRTRNA